MLQSINLTRTVSIQWINPLRFPLTNSRCKCSNSKFNNVSHRWELPTLCLSKCSWHTINQKWIQSWASCIESLPHFRKIKQIIYERSCLSSMNPSLCTTWTICLQMCWSGTSLLPWLMGKLWMAVTNALQLDCSKCCWKPRRTTATKSQRGKRKSSILKCNWKSDWC